ncbi:MAG: sel1 repeat family protein [Magnetococcales bacterium]|nr:sel1 repeat family protein [Magnetococcales bacterium]
MLPPTEQIDPKRYLALVRALALEGNAKAQHNLGAMYLKGLGVPKDPVQAAEWFARAGEQGDMHARHNMGVLCLQGIGVARDPAQAARWFQLAARQGDPRSAQCLGALYFEGAGVPRDLVRAYVWMQRALSGVPEALREQIREALSLIGERMDPQSLSHAQGCVPFLGAEDET